MAWRQAAAFAAAALVCPLAAQAQPASAPTATSPARPFRIFDGKPKTICLWTGGHRGIVQLEAHIKRMPGAEEITCLHSVSPVTRRKFPIDDGDALRKWPAAFPVADDDLPDYCPRADLNDPKPVIYIVMSGALRAKGFPPEPNACSAQEAIRRGVEIMQAAVRQTAARGVSWVMLSTMYYNPNPAWPGSVGWVHDRELVEAFNRTQLGKRHPAVDVSTATARVFPLHLDADAFHINDYARHVLAHLWLSALCAWDGIEVPAWSGQMLEEARKQITKARESIRDVRAAEVALVTAPTGRALEVTWRAEPAIHDFSAEFYRCEQYFAGRGGSNGAGRFYAMSDSRISREEDRWKLLWPLPADAPSTRIGEIQYREPTAHGNPDAKETFVNGHHYFIRISSRPAGAWTLSMPVRLGVPKAAASVPPRPGETPR